MGERVAIFIDGSNFYHSLKNAFRKASVDFSKLVVFLVGGRSLVRTYYYTAPRRKQDDEKKYRDQQLWFDRLRRLDYFEVKLGRLEPRGKTLVEKGVDVKLAVDMLHGAFRNTYDTAVLISGDADYVDAVEVVKQQGKHVELVSIVGQQCYHLRNACDVCRTLDAETLAPMWLPGKA